jgi:hypothetical protein
MKRIETSELPLVHQPSDLPFHPDREIGFAIHRLLQMEAFHFLDSIAAVLEY